MNYRIAVMTDIDHICVMVSKAIKHMQEQGIDQWDEIYPNRKDFMDDICKGTLYVAEERDKLAAIYVISQECDDEYKKCTWNSPDTTACVIHRLCVSPDFQNQGVGKQILDHIEEQLREGSYTSIRLDVYTKNPYALKLYTNNGYEERGYADWRKGRFLLMEKKL